MIAAGVAINDSNAIATFGAGSQRKLSGFLEQLVADTRADDIGVAGALVTELATHRPEIKMATWGNRERVRPFKRCTCRL